MRTPLGRVVSVLALSMLGLTCTVSVAQAASTQPAAPSAVVISDPGPGDGGGPKTVVIPNGPSTRTVVISNGDAPTTGPK
jgi:hypothetical protein